MRVFKVMVRFNHDNEDCPITCYNNSEAEAIESLGKELKHHGVIVSKAYDITKPKNYSLLWFMAGFGLSASLLLLYLFCK